MSGSTSPRAGSGESGASSGASGRSAASRAAFRAATRAAVDPVVGVRRRAARRAAGELDVDEVDAEALLSPSPLVSAELARRRGVRLLVGGQVVVCSSAELRALAAHLSAVADEADRR